MSKVRTVLAAAVTGAALAMSSLAAAQPAPPYYVFLYRPGPAWKPGLPMARQDMRPHGAYMTKLDREGRIVAAGGWPDKGGMAIVRAASLEEARGLLAADPAVTSGLFVADLQPWSPRFGDPSRAAPAAARLN